MTEESKKTEERGKRSSAEDTGFPEEEIKKGKLMAVIAYILFPVSLIAGRDNRFAMFHTEQGVVLMALWIVNALISTAATFSFDLGFFVLPVLSAALVILHVTGIIFAVLGEARVLPLVGRYGRALNLTEMQ